jgi:cysteinyl-tRNA synthetase
LGNLIYNIQFLLQQSRFTNKIDNDSKSLLDKKMQLGEKFIQAMDDDFNTPVALSTLFLLAKEANIYLNHEGSKNREVLQEVLKFYEKYGSRILGFKYLSKMNEQERVKEKEIEEMIQERELARGKGDWKTADRIRTQLEEMGIILEDTAEGIRWKKA